MNKIIKLLMEKNKISEKEANDICCKALDMMEQLKYDPYLCQEIFVSENRIAP